jgi:hypothetical protein
MVEDVSIDTHHACWIIMVAMDGEYRQANIEVRVLIVDMPKFVLEVDSLITDNLELDWTVIEAVSSQNFYGPHKGGTRRLIFMEQITS